MPEEEKSKKDNEKTTRKALWKPDETQMYQFYESVRSKPREESRRNEDSSK